MANDRSPLVMCRACRVYVHTVALLVARIISGPTSFMHADLSIFLMVCLNIGPLQVEMAYIEIRLGSNGLVPPRPAAALGGRAVGGLWHDAHCGKSASPERCALLWSPPALMRSCTKMISRTRGPHRPQVTSSLTAKRFLRSRSFFRSPSTSAILLRRSEKSGVRSCLYVR